MYRLQCIAIFQGMKGDLCMEMAKVTSKGQITIPVSIRRRLGIKEGDKLLFIDSPDGVVMVNPDMLQGKEDEGAVDRGTITDPAVAKQARGSLKTDHKSTPAKPAAAGEDKPDVKPAVDKAALHTSNIEDPKPGMQIKGVDIGALLDEIRSIGSKI